jgi:uncharacterized membrane protein
MQNATLLQDPMAIFAYLAAVVALVFWLSGLRPLQKLFEITPPIIYAYFLPTLSTTFGITPAASPLYDWMTRYLLPFALLLLMISIDLRAVSRLGTTALLMMLIGSAGIVIGAPISFLLFRDLLPPDAWKGLAALSGSWIGGSANLVAIAESVGTPDDVMSPIIIVDTVMTFGWMGILLFLSAYQTRFDRRIGARTQALDETNRRLEAIDTRREPIDTRLALEIGGLGVAGAVARVYAGARLPAIGTPHHQSHDLVVLVVVTGGLFVFTPVRARARRRLTHRLCCALSAARGNRRAGESQGRAHCARLPRRRRGVDRDSRGNPARRRATAKGTALLLCNRQHGERRRRGIRAYRSRRLSPRDGTGRFADGRARLRSRHLRRITLRVRAERVGEMTCIRPALRASGPDESNDQGEAPLSARTVVRRSMSSPAPRTAWPGPRAG